MPTLPHKARRAYYSQKSAARQRGIAFELSFEEWWDIWLSSGRWEQRGSRAGQYCMARKLDRGGYSVGNVDIVTVFDNVVTRMEVQRDRKLRRRVGTKVSAWTEHTSSIEDLLIEEQEQECG